MRHFLFALALLVGAGSAQASGLYGPFLKPQADQTLFGNVSGSNAVPAGLTTAQVATLLGLEVNVKSYGAKGDTQALYDGAATGTAFTSANATFTSADVGKYIRITGAGAAGISQLRSIAAYVSAHAVTLSSAVTTNVTGAKYWYGTDDTAAVEAAIAGITNSCIHFPAGAYWLVTKSTTTTLQQTCIIGDGPPAIDSTTTTKDYTDAGSALLIEDTVNAPFAPGRGNKIQGLSFFWPAQDGSAVAPIVYPPLFETTNVSTTTFQDLYVVNAYRYFQLDAGFAGSGCGRVTNVNVQGYAIDKVVYLKNGCADVLTFDDNSRWSPGFAQTIALTGNAYLAKYTDANGVFLDVDVSAGAYTSVDGFQMVGTFTHGYRRGIYVESGTMDSPRFSEVTWDSTPTLLEIIGTAKIVHGNFTGGKLYSNRNHSGTGAETDDAFKFSCTGTLTTLNITGMALAYSRGHMFNDTTACLRTVNLVGNTIQDWGQSSTAGTYDALNIGDSGLRLNVSANVFRSDAVAGNTLNAIAISSVTRANITSNEFLGASNVQLVTSNSVGQGEVSGNLANSTVGANAWVDTSSGSAVWSDLGNIWDAAPDTAHATDPNGIYATGYASLTGATSGAFATTVGGMIDSPARTFNDTGAGGTIASRPAYSFGIPTFTATNATTYTNASTLRIGGVPVCSTNVTCGSNLFSLDVTGLSIFRTGVQVVGATTINKNNNNATEIGDGTTTSTVTVGGGANAVVINSTTSGSVTTGTGSFTSGAFSTTLSATGHTTFEGVTSTGATGTGKLVYDGTPTLVTPVLGVATATSVNKVAITAPATSATLTIANSKTLTATNTMDVAKTAGVSGGIPYYDSTTSQSSSALLTANAYVKGGGAGTTPASGQITDDGTTITLPGTTVNITATTLQRSGNTVLLGRRFTATYDPASLTAATAREDTVTVTGVTTAGGAVAINLPTTMPAGCVIANIYVSAADTVKVDWQNTNTVAACDVASSTAVFTQAQ